MTTATARVGASAQTDLNASSDYWERLTRVLVGRGLEETGK